MKKILKTILWVLIGITVLVIAPLLAAIIGVALPVIAVVGVLLLPGIIIGIIAATRK